MATLHSLLGLYGALDDAVVEQPDNPLLTETVEEFLPGTTGDGQRGWFSEIRNFVRDLSIDPAATEFPDRSTALQEFAALGEQEEDPGIPAPEMLRYLYVMSALGRLRGIGEDDLYAQALAVAVPRTGTIAPIEGGERLLQLLTEINRADFRSIIADSPHLVGGDVAFLAQNASLDVEIGRDQCGPFAILRTEVFRENLPLADVKAVVDPLNWKLCSTFFCDMRPFGTGYDDYGWSRVLEVISTLCPFAFGYRLRTPIKYFKFETDSGVVVNYDLDDRPSDVANSGRVTVDRGFISVQEEPDGVRVRTLKQVKFVGMSPLATLMFGVIGGYAAIGESMLVGCALNRPNGNVDWAVSKPTTKPYKEFDPNVCRPQPSDPCDTACLPGASEAATMWAECVTETSTEWAGLVNKWAKCGFDPADVIGFGSSLSLRMATEPWKIASLWLDAAQALQPSRPPTTSHQHRGHR